MLAVFQLYGLNHILTLSLIVVVAVFLIRCLREELKTSRATPAVYVLAFLCFISYPLNQAAVSMLDGSHDPSSMLPLHLCDIAAFLCGFALITRKPLLCELSYFWGLSGTIQGLITPNIMYEFPSPAYISFFLQHGVIVITAVILPMGLGWKPRPHAARRTYACLLGYAVSILGINCVLKTNFGFVMGKPDGASLLDVLGAWPWYILWTLLFAAGIFWLLELPFKRRLHK